MKPDDTGYLRGNRSQKLLRTGGVYTKQSSLFWDVGPRDKKYKYPQIYNEQQWLRKRSDDSVFQKEQVFVQQITPNFMNTYLATLSCQNYHHQLAQEEIKNDLLGVWTRTRNSPEGKQRRIRF